MKRSSFSPRYFYTSTSISTTATATLNQEFNPQEPSILVIDEMPPPLPPLKNYYYLLRHGQSTANVEGIISSARSLARSTKHGLTLLGIEQGKNAAASLIDLIAEDLSNDNVNIPKSTKQVYFYSSPFARAKETAYACLKGMRENKEVANKVKKLGLDVKEDVILEDRLMERWVLDPIDLFHNFICIRISRVCCREDVVL